MKIDPCYSIGIDEMDTQHARWIQLITEFSAASSGRLHEPTAFIAASSALERLVDYTKDHFRSEEEFLRKHEYPDLVAHQKQHHELERTVLNMTADIRERRSNHTPVKLNFLATQWLLDHIQREDAKYAQYILRLAK
jgi:hemerythrin